MAEVDFASTPAERIVGELLDDGCVLLRNFTDPEQLEAMRVFVEDAYAGVAGPHVYARDLAARGLPAFHEALFGERHDALLARLFGGYGFAVSKQTIARSIDPHHRSERWLRPLAPHLDAFSHEPEFTVNFWVPLRPCDSEVPRLGVVRAGFAEVLRYTGFDPGRAPLPAGRRRFLPQFDPAMSALFDAEPAAMGRFRNHFGAAIWAPEYRLGDAMMLTNWTLHFTHATADMAIRRTNLELRFSGPASLAQILAAHGIPAA